MYLQSFESSNYLDYRAKPCWWFFSGVVLGFCYYLSRTIGDRRYEIAVFSSGSSSSALIGYFCWSRPGRQIYNYIRKFDFSLVFCGFSELCAIFVGDFLLYVCVCVCGNSLIRHNETFPRSSPPLGLRIWPLRWLATDDYIIAE